MRRRINNIKYSTRALPAAQRAEAAAESRNSSTQMMKLFCDTGGTCGLGVVTSLARSSTPLGGDSGEPVSFNRSGRRPDPCVHGRCRSCITRVWSRARGLRHLSRAPSWTLCAHVCAFRFVLHVAVFQYTTLIISLFTLFFHVVHVKEQCKNIYINNKIVIISHCAAPLTL